MLQATAAFFKAGLERRELCLWAVSEPVTAADAIGALRAQIVECERYAEAQDIKITSGENWNLKEDEFNLQRIAGHWHEEVDKALELGYEGLRVSGNASWLETSHWKEFCEYDLELDRCVSGKKIIALCTHSLSAKRAVDVPDVVRAHHFTVYRRNDKWEFADTPEEQAVAGAWLQPKNILGKRFLGDVELTPREKAVLVQIIQGLSSKEIGRNLGISPRTIEFHRANIMSKTGAKNVADLTRTWVGEYGLERVFSPA